MTSKQDLYIYKNIGRGLLGERMVFRGNGAEISRRQQGIKRDYANQQPVEGGEVVDKNITDPYEGG